MYVCMVFRCTPSRRAASETFPFVALSVAITIAVRACFIAWLIGILSLTTVRAKLSTYSFMYVYPISLDEMSDDCLGPPRSVAVHTHHNGKLFVASW